MFLPNVYHKVVHLCDTICHFFRVIECMGPTNTRIYTVAVYFRGIRLAKATGHSIQQAEMNAAKNALNNSKGRSSKNNPKPVIYSPKCVKKQLFSGSGIHTLFPLK